MHRPAIRIRSLSGNRPASPPTRRTRNRRNIRAAETSGEAATIRNIRVGAWAPRSP